MSWNTSAKKFPTDNHEISHILKLADASKIRSHNPIAVHNRFQCTEKPTQYKITPNKTTAVMVSSHFLFKETTHNANVREMDVVVPIALGD